MSVLVPVRQTNNGNISLISFGEMIGTVEQECSLCVPRFRIKNAAGDVVLRIVGPFWTSSCGQDINLDVSCSQKSRIEMRIAQSIQNNQRFTEIIRYLTKSMLSLI